MIVLEILKYVGAHGYPDEECKHFNDKAAALDYVRQAQEEFSRVHYIKDDIMYGYGALCTYMNIKDEDIKFGELYVAASSHRGLWWIMLFKVVEIKAGQWGR